SLRVLRCFSSPGSLLIPMNSGSNTSIQTRYQKSGIGNQNKPSDPRHLTSDPWSGSGFPHSEIRGSKLVRSSPRLIAAYHVLHRLRVPRHPPNALKALDRSHYQCPPPPRGGSDRKPVNSDQKHEPSSPNTRSRPRTALFWA